MEEHISLVVALLLFQGVPFPSQEQSAIDVVVQFVLEKLDFKLQDVVLFSWSIGGYASTYAAMSYPDVKHVV